MPIGIGIFNPTSFCMADSNELGPHSTPLSLKIISTKRNRAEGFSERDSREASISGFRGHAVGACIIVTADELDLLGIDPEKIDSVQYRFDTGEDRLLLTPIQ